MSDITESPELTASRAEKCWVCGKEITPPPPLRLAQDSTILCAECESKRTIKMDVPVILPGIVKSMNVTATHELSGEAVTKAVALAFRLGYLWHNGEWELPFGSEVSGWPDAELMDATIKGQEAAIAVMRAKAKKQRKRIAWLCEVLAAEADRGGWVPGKSRKPKFWKREAKREAKNG
jgi:DNA-directed RNA polymerase subunit RPC12/RpoP